MSWRRNFADYQNALSQKSADKLMEEFEKHYKLAAAKIIPSFMEVYKEAVGSAGEIKNLAPETLFHLDSYWTLLGVFREELESLGNDIISLMNNQFHVMYVDVFEGIAPGGMQLPCFISSEEIQQAIDGVWGVDKKNWRERVWIKMTCLWDKLAGVLMESVIKKRTLNQFQAALQREFNENRKQLNSTMMIDISRIQAKAALTRSLIANTLAVNDSAKTAAYIMTYGDESEISELSAEDIEAVQFATEQIEANKAPMIRMMSMSRMSGAEYFHVPKIEIHVQWISEGDDLVCDACAGMDGSEWTFLDVEEIDEIEFPLHPNCRCVLECEMTMDGSIASMWTQTAEGSSSGKYKTKDTEDRSPKYTQRTYGDPYSWQGSGPIGSLFTTYKQKGWSYEKAQSEKAQYDNGHKVQGWWN